MKPLKTKNEVGSSMKTVAKYAFIPPGAIRNGQGRGRELRSLVEKENMPTNSILDRGIQIDGLGMKSFMTYESNVLFALRFMIDCNIVDGNWIEVPVEKHKKAAWNLSYSQLEFDCIYSDLINHPPEGEFSKMAPFRILSFDIECAGRKGHFPEPTQDPVIQVANLVTLQGQD
ncbi:dna polymerase delta catalytic subunit [Nicotiana attenuata]|uniref:DNA polymerase delta catalytic subunit n=1 Tax=Nicotiana attenuata TaxID=49451 RepID=A0A1J6KDR0_NICAT|nr:dna polymerase delta catalytic subunit [Nicotiana attenuata]